MRKSGRVIMLLCFGLVAGEASSQDWDMPSELWEMPRSGAAVRAQAPLRQCVQAYLAEPGSRILLHHAGNEESLLRAEELRAWLVALAVETTRIELVADLKLNRNLNVELISPALGKPRNGQEERK